MATFVPSQKGQRKLILGADLFNKVRNGTTGKELWKCEVRTCNARVHTQADVIVLELGAHDHAPVRGKATVTNVRAQIKRRAQETEETTRVIIQESLAHVMVGHSHLLPSRATVARDVCRHRTKVNDINLCTNTINGDLFLRVQEPDMIIFAAQTDIDVLVGSKHWFADGTFRVTPADFDQMYTIHAFVNDQTYPCIYALLPGRTEDVYRRFLQHIVTLAPAAAPVSIMTDFELAAINANRVTFPGAEMTGCFFHFGQNVWRKLQAEGKTQLYIANEEYSLKVKEMMALAFVPETDVIAAFEQLTSQDHFRELDFPRP